MSNQTAVLLCAVAALALSARGQQAEPVGAAAVWQPAMSVMSALRDKCAAATDFGSCFVAEMGASGASAQAVAFTKLTGGAGFMRDFREAGRVDVAYVDYPFRANQNQGCLLVNGSPVAIDVNDVSAMPPNLLMKNRRYAALARKHPDMTLFPGDRGGTAYPTVRNLPAGGQRFVFAYNLQDGCRACARLATAEIAFDFDRSGKLLGRELLAVKTAGAAKN